MGSHYWIMGFRDYSSFFLQFMKVPSFIMETRNSVVELQKSEDVIMFTNCLCSNSGVMVGIFVNPR